MSDTHVLLGKIAALRQQLEQAQDLTSNPAPPREPQAVSSSRQTQHVDDAFRQIPSSAATDSDNLPRQLTATARRILEQGRELLHRLRGLGDVLESGSPDSADPLAQRYNQTVAMTETALRMIQAFPDTPSVQLRLCDGVEAVFGVVVERVAGLAAALDQRHKETNRVTTLAGLLVALYEHQPVAIDTFAGLAETIVAEARDGAPLRFFSAPAQRCAEFIASHSLTVAQVVARVVRHDPDFRLAPLEPVISALLHDAGMLAVPSVILAQPGPLNDAQRRTIEEHTRIGARLAARLAPTAVWLTEAVAGHHERLDGTGYPAGLRDNQLAPMTRLLAVCDVYAALCAPRQQRPALDTRTALADTLLLAEKGGLDRYQAERLLQLSFYPVGAVVELADGAVGLVVATQVGRRDLQSPARPVVALLTDPQGRPLPLPHHVDLAQCEGRSIVRTLPREERRNLLGPRYPELAA
jgi:HD-GYP domain-containing protein (c-di-GMP phosphodiesterase class II)